MSDVRLLAGVFRLWAAVVRLTVRQTRVSFRADLTRLCWEAKAADESGSGSTADYEPQLVAVLGRCEQEIAAGGEREVTAGLVAIGKGEIPAPYDTLMFCLHKLRLRQVLEEMESYHRSLDPYSRRSHDWTFGYLPHIRKSLEEDWEDRDLYAAYRVPK